MASKPRASINNSVGVQIGASQAAIAEARAALNDILRSSNADTTKVAAVETLRELCRVQSAVVTGCNISTVEK